MLLWLIPTLIVSQSIRVEPMGLFQESPYSRNTQEEMEEISYQITLPAQAQSFEESLGHL